MKRSGILTDWHHRRVTAGKEWRGIVDEHLQSADVVLLLVSADFLASDYLCDVEVKRALARHDAGEALVIPVLLRPCDWSSADFARLTALPTDGTPVTSWANQDDAWKNVAVGIRDALGTMSRRVPAERVDQLPMGSRGGRKAPDVRRLVAAAAVAVLVVGGIAYVVRRTQAPPVPPLVDSAVSTASTAPPSPPAPAPRTAVIDTNPQTAELAKVHEGANGRVRDKPEPGKPNRIQHDTTVEILEEEPVNMHPWYRVRCKDGGEGWVDGDVLSFDGQPSQSERRWLKHHADAATSTGR